MGFSTRQPERDERRMKGLAKAGRIMYNIIDARRPTDRRSQAEPGGRASGRPSDACPAGACEARGGWLVGGPSQVHGRMGLGGLENLASLIRAKASAAHQSRSRGFRPGFRSVRTQVSAPQTASRMKPGKNQFPLLEGVTQPELARPARKLSRKHRRLCIRLTFRRLPAVASGKPWDLDRSFRGAGSTLAEACFGLENGVHPKRSGRACPTSGAVEPDEMFVGLGGE